MKIFLTNAVRILALLVLFCSCTALPPLTRPPLEDEGLVFIYIQPFPHEADRLSFSLAAVAAVRDDGQEFPLTLRPRRLGGAEFARQRLLCEGALPQGSYQGITFHTSKATLQVEDGTADLLLPEKPARVDFRFRVAPRKASILFAAFDFGRSVIDEFSFSPVFTMSSPPKPVIAVSGYVSNYASYALSVFDKNAMLAVGAVEAARRPTGLALDQRQKRLYTAMPEDDAVMIIDATTQEMQNTVRLRLGDSPQCLALSPDGRLLFIVNAGSNTVSVVDTSLQIETSRISVGNGPSAILMDRAGRRAYVFNTLSNTVSVIDVPNRALAASLSTTEPAPLWGQFNAKGDRLYIISGQSPYLTVVDPVLFKALSRVYVGMGLTSLKVDPVTDLIYAGKRNDPVVEVYDPLSFVAFDRIAVGSGPTYMTIDGEGNNLWIAGGSTGKLIIVDLASKKVVSEIDVGEEPFWLVMMGER